MTDQEKTPGRALYDALEARIIEELSAEKTSAGWGTVALNILKGTGTLNLIQAEIQAEIDSGDEAAAERQRQLRALPFRKPEEVAAEGGLDDDEYDERERLPDEGVA